LDYRIFFKHKLKSAGTEILKFSAVPETHFKSILMFEEGANSTFVG